MAKQTYGIVVVFATRCNRQHVFVAREGDEGPCENRKYVGVWKNARL